MSIGKTQANVTTWRMSTRMYIEIAVLTIVVLNILGTMVAFADSTGNQGQPSQSCQSVFPTGPLTPIGFNTAGFTNAANNYAGNQPQNSNNPNSVAQYDVACFQAGQHNP